MPRRGGKVRADVPPDIVKVATHIEGDKNNNKPETEAETEMDATCNRTLRTVKRGQLSSIVENEQLRKQSLQEDGMTDQTNSDIGLQKAIAASRESAEAKNIEQNTLLASKLDGMVLSLSSSSEMNETIVSNGSQEDLISAATIGNPIQTEARAQLSSDETGSEKLAGADDEKVLELKSGLMAKPLFAPDGVDPDQYARAIMEELTRHHEQLYAMQRQSSTILEWGPPVIGTLSAAANQILQKFDKFDAVAQRPTSRWSCAKPSAAASSKNPEPSSLDIDAIIDIESPTSDESSQEEFLIGRKPKKTKKAVKRLAPKNVKLPLKGAQQGTADAKKGPCLKRKGTVEKDEKPKVKQTRSDDIFTFTEDEASQEEETASSERPTMTLRFLPRKDTQEKKVADMVACPLCGEQFSKDVVEEHASDCVGGVQGDSDFAVSQSSKIIDFAHSRCCIVCGDNYALDVIDDHIAVCKLEEKSKQSKGSTTSVGTPRGTKPDQFYATNRRTLPTSPFDTFCRNRGGLR